jgi:hypothetical protein
MGWYSTGGRVPSVCAKSKSWSPPALSPTLLVQSHTHEPPRAAEMCDTTTRPGSTAASSGWSPRACL